jgi:hypothetical protein
VNNTFDTELSLPPVAPADKVDNKVSFAETSERQNSSGDSSLQALENDLANFSIVEAAPNSYSPSNISMISAFSQVRPLAFFFVFFL